VFVCASPLYLKGKPFTQDGLWKRQISYERDHLQHVIWKGPFATCHKKKTNVPSLISSLLPVSTLIFGGNPQKSAKIRKKSQKIDFKRRIRQSIFRFLKIDFFGSISATHTATHTATHGNSLQHTATHCAMDSVLDSDSTRCNSVQQTLQQTLATHCNSLQHTATRCATDSVPDSYSARRKIHESTATRCNTLQHAATHCNAVHHIKHTT